MFLHKMEYCVFSRIIGLGKVKKKAGFLEKEGDSIEFWLQPNGLHPFGYAVELACTVLPASFSGRLPRDRPANAPFYDAVEGLVRCFRAQAMPREAESLTAFARRLQDA